MERPESRSYYADEASDASALEALLQLAAGPAAPGLPAPSPADSTALAHAQSLERSLEARPRAEQAARAASAQDVPAADRPAADAGSRDKSAYFVEHDEPRGVDGAQTAPAPAGGNGEAAAQAQPVGTGSLQSASASNETGAVPPAESADGVAHTSLDRRQGKRAKTGEEGGAERLPPQTHDRGSLVPATLAATDPAVTGVAAGRGGEREVPAACETSGVGKSKESAREVPAAQTSTAASTATQDAGGSDTLVEACPPARKQAQVRVRG